EGVSQLIRIQHPRQLLTGLRHTLPVVRVDDEDNALGVLEVMSPQGTDLVLSSDIPHGERNVLVLDSLDVEPYQKQHPSATIATPAWITSVTWKCGTGQFDGKKDQDLG